MDLSGRSEVVARVHSFPFSLDWLPSGELVVVSAAERRLLKLEGDGAFSSYADLKPISDKGWNEIVIDGRANAHVNRGGFDLKAGEPFAPGVIALVTPDGVARQVADGIAFPNGMAVTPDNSTLIVAEAYAARPTAFEIAADGTLSNRRAWAELGEAAPDGICIDASGAVWYADVPNKRCVRVRAGGEVLDQGRTRPWLLLVRARRSRRPDAVHRRPPVARVGRGRGGAADRAGPDRRGA